MRHQLRYFEDYQVGQKGVTLARTVTEADIVNFACLSADFNRIHVDQYDSANNIYGGRVAHGLLGASLVTGMLSLTAPHILGRGVPEAYLWNLDVNYRGAIRLGDTIRTQWTIAEKASDPAHEGFGLLKTAFQVVTQEGDYPYEGILSTVVGKEEVEGAKLQLEPGQPWQVREFTIDPEEVHCLEDYPVGEGGETDGRTITEADVVNFAGLTGDYDPQYVDAEYARKSLFGQRVAHGMLIYAITHALWSNDWDRYRQPKLRIAGHLSDKVTFLAPVKIGDTIRCRYKIAASRISKSKPEAGLITYGLQVINQRKEVVQEGAVVNMIPTRE